MPQHLGNNIKNNPIKWPNIFECIMDFLVFSLAEKNICDPGPQNQS